MNKYKKLLIILVIFSIVLVIFSVRNRKSDPIVNQYNSPSPSAFLDNPPKTYKFDSSTDLKRELENINPQVLESDFER